MTKLPKIFHNNDKYISNNKNSFKSFDIEKSNDNSFDSDSLIYYFNKNIDIHLKDGSVVSGVLISKRGENILLKNGIHVNTKDIDYVK